MSIMLMALAMAAAGSPDTAIGKWKTETRNGIVEITRCGSSLCGKLLTSDGIAANPALKDAENKDEKLRGRPLKGLQILAGFHWADGAWKGGTIYKADNGKTYDASITTVDANTLKLKGCVMAPLCSTQTWTRVR
ncbi:MAG: DUF2147 domain-containing protein [Alphaproteobacteria bacterium]|nr:MAG: DUF2147 domain-containing protein [Alphaproteobacteria bacterium]